MEIATLSRAKFIVGSKVFIMRPLEEIVLLCVREETELVILENDLIFFEIRLIDDRSPIFKTHPHIVEEVLDWIFVIIAVEVGADSNFLDSNLPNPLLEHCVIFAIRVIPNAFLI